jgi:hypothetical protein
VNPALDLKGLEWGDGGCMHAKYSFILTLILVGAAWCPSFSKQDNKGEKTKPKDEMVHITKTGKRYHLSTCRFAATAFEIARNKAIMAGYTPCKVCRPGGPTREQTGKPATANDGRCKATTKKGTRCKRSAGSGGYCWQPGK